MKRATHLASVATAVATVLLSLGFGLLGIVSLDTSAAATTSKAPGIPPIVRTALLEYAQHNAAFHGDARPYDIQAVRTTHKKARSLRGGSSSKPPSDTAVYVVAMRGHFRCGCAPPLGDHIPQPTGSVIAFEIIAESNPELEVIAWGLGNRYPRLQSVGTPIHLRFQYAH